MVIYIGDIVNTSKTWVFHCPQVMLNWLTATNIRLRLMQTKTMLGHLMSVAQVTNTNTNENTNKNTNENANENTNKIQMKIQI